MQVHNELPIALPVLIFTHAQSSTHLHLSRVRYPCVKYLNGIRTCYPWATGRMLSHYAMTTHYAIIHKNRPRQLKLEHLILTNNNAAIIATMSVSYKTIQGGMYCQQQP